MKLKLGYLALASILLILAVAVVLLAQGSPEARYAPVGTVAGIMLGLAIVIGGALVYLSVKV